MIFVGTPERLPLREKCPNTELFLVLIFLYIQSEYRKIWTRNNSVFGHFSRSVYEKDFINSEVAINNHTSRKLLELIGSIREGNAVDKHL